MKLHLAKVLLKLFFVLCIKTAILTSSLSQVAKVGSRILPSLPTALAFDVIDCRLFYNPQPFEVVSLINITEVVRYTTIPESTEVVLIVL